MSSSPVGINGWERLSRSLRAEDAEDVLLLHDEVLLAAQLDLAAGILAEEDSVAFLHREREVLAIVVHLAGAYGDDLALLRLLLGAVGDDEAAVLFVLFREPLDEHAVMERPQRRLHGLSHRGCLSHSALRPSSFQVVRAR